MHFTEIRRPNCLRFARRVNSESYALQWLVIMCNTWYECILMSTFTDCFGNTGNLSWANRGKILCPSGRFCVRLTTANQAAISFVFPLWVVNEYHENYLLAFHSRRQRGLQPRPPSGNLSHPVREKLSIRRGIATDVITHLYILQTMSTCYWFSEGK